LEKCGFVLTVTNMEGDNNEDVAPTLEA